MAVIVECPDCGTQYEVQRGTVAARDWMQCPRCAAEPVDEHPECIANA